MDDRAIVARQLGRPPRAFRRVAVRCPFGSPAVTEQDPYDADGNPFPTTYYLTCPQLVAALARIEAAGGVERWSRAQPRRPPSSPARSSGRRRSSGALRRELAGERRGRTTALRSSSESGARASPGRLKCLHAHAAFALARPGYVTRRADPRGGRPALAPDALLLRRRRRARSASIRAVTADVESARRDWEEAYRRLREEARDPSRADGLHVELGGGDRRAPQASRLDVHAPRARDASTARRTPGRARPSPSERAARTWLGDARRSWRARRSISTPAARSTTSRRGGACSNDRAETARAKPQRRKLLVRASARPPSARARVPPRDRLRAHARRAGRAGRSRHERPHAHAAPAGAAGAHGDRDGDLALTGGRGSSARYSSSEASSRPATMIPTAQSEADPDPDPATREEERVGDRDEPDEHENRRDRADRDRDQALGNRVGQARRRTRAARPGARRRARGRGRPSRSFPCASR